MYRLALEHLNNWYSDAGRKPMIIRGARQVGKSTLVKLFTERQGLELLSINCERVPNIQDLFISKDPKQIIALLELQFNKNIIPGTTLLFLDEIQDAPLLLASLRYFYEEMPKLHIIAAGSLLEFALEDLQFSMPVGRIEYLHLGPMTFSEFLYALGEVQLVKFLDNFTLQQEIPQSIHQKLMRLTRTFCIIGGMPEAIVKYVATKSFLAPEQAKQSILQTYADDFNKYNSKGNTKELVKLLFHRLSSTIGNKFKYSNISHNEKAANVAMALQQLCKARIAYMVQHSNSNGVPLHAEVSHKVFKILFLDVGLIATDLAISYLDLCSQEELTLVNSGAITEHFIGQHLLYAKPYFEKPQLHYWIREKQTSNAEVDYIVNYGAKIIPVEVKSGRTGTLKSLHYFLKEKNLQIGVRFNSEPAKFSEHKVNLTNKQSLDYKLLSLPLYLVEQLSRLLSSIA